MAIYASCTLAIRICLCFLWKMNLYYYLLYDYENHVIFCFIKKPIVIIPSVSTRTFETKWSSIRRCQFGSWCLETYEVEMIISNIQLLCAFETSLIFHIFRKEWKISINITYFQKSQISCMIYYTLRISLSSS